MTIKITHTKNIPFHESMLNIIKEQFPNRNLYYIKNWKALKSNAYRNNFFCLYYCKNEDCIHGNIVTNLKNAKEYIATRDEYAIIKDLKIVK